MYTYTYKQMHIWLLLPALLVTCRDKQIQENGTSSEKAQKFVLLSRGNDLMKCCQTRLSWFKYEVIRTSMLLVGHLCESRLKTTPNLWQFPSSEAAYGEIFVPKIFICYKITWLFQPRHRLDHRFRPQVPKGHILCDKKKTH